MSAAEVIELIKQLPPDEKEQVHSYVLSGTDTVSPREPRYIPTAEVERTAAEIFEKHADLFRKLAQ
jgi:hypothetical protein